MRPTEVVVSEMEGDSRPERREPLREGIGQPRESAHGHSHGEVLSLHVGRGYALPVGVSGYYGGVGCHEVRWPVSVAGDTVLPEVLDLLGIVGVGSEGLLDGPDVGGETVSGDLDAVSVQAGPQLLHEAVGTIGVPLPDVEAGNELCVRVQGDKDELVAPLRRIAAVQVALLGMDIRPNLVALDRAQVQFLHLRFEEPGTPVSNTLE